MLTSFRLIRCSKRSSGPSKFSSLTGNASTADSKSGALSVTRRPHIADLPREFSNLLDSSVRDLDRIAHTRHCLPGYGSRATSALFLTLTQIPRACHDG